ncbi:MAG: hypothetical protein M3R17_06515 [Bacteroidota bacterium]|nr:hypothetical protein [Bacteroidota bacterium]
MKQPGSLLKFSVFMIFIVMISGFVAYRAGVFDEYLTADKRTDAKAEDTVNDDEMMSSSKSTLLMTPEVQSEPQTTQAAPNENHSDNSNLVYPKKDVMMSSSKSMTMSDYRPQPDPNPNAGIFAKGADTLKQQQQPKK